MYVALVRSARLLIEPCPVVIEARYTLCYGLSKKFSEIDVGFVLYTR